MKIRWTVNWPNTFQLKSIPIHLTVHTQKHTSCCKPTSVMPCCLVQIMQLIQRRCWTKQSEYARYHDAFQHTTLVGLLFIVRVLSYFESRRIWRFLAILWRAGTIWCSNTFFRGDLDVHNGSHFTELEVNKLRVKDSGALTGGIYCHRVTSALYATTFYLGNVVWESFWHGCGPCRLFCWPPRTCLPGVLLLFYHSKAP